MLRVADGRRRAGASRRPGRRAPVRALAAAASRRWGWSRPRSCGRRRRTTRGPASGSTSRSCSSRPTAPSPGYGAWKAELDREGVPYDTLRRLHRRRQDRDADRRPARRLCREPREVPGGDPGDRRPRARGGQPRRHGQLPLGPDRRRVGGAREARAHVRRPAAERLHGALAAARPRRRRGRRDGRRPGRRAHGGRQGGLPVPQGPDADPERRAGGRRGVRLRGHAGERRRLADARRRPDRGRRPGWASTRTRRTGARRWS